MNTNLSILPYTSSFLSPIPKFILKPIVYLVMFVALAIILGRCWKAMSGSKPKKVEDKSKEGSPAIPAATKALKTDASKGKTDGTVSSGQKEASTPTPIGVEEILTPDPALEEPLPEIPLTFETLVDSSKNFAARTPFSTTANLIENFATTPELQAKAVEHAKTTRPVVHHRLMNFISKFIKFKKDHGTDIEKALYEKLTRTEFLDRLIKKRPLVFIGNQDAYKLRDGTTGKGGFEQVGQAKELENLCLANYLSYDEMRLSALMSAFVPTHFINNGNRKNSGMTEGTFEQEGIFVGMVGARFEKPGFMEFSHMLVTPHQNTAANGYGLLADPNDPKTIELRLWAEFYGSRVEGIYTFPSYEEASKDPSGRYYGCRGAYLDTFVYHERLKLTIEPFLLEANARAKAQDKQAYLHLVGLGLGSWAMDGTIYPLKKIMLEVYSELLKKHPFDHISDLNFSGFGGGWSCGGVKNGTLDYHNHPIRVHFSQRDPAEKLTCGDEGKLLIAQYAWDSNAYPGNKYYLGALDDETSDPMAACYSGLAAARCSGIVELQNPEINPYFSGTYATVLPKVKPAEPPPAEVIAKVL